MGDSRAGEHLSTSALLRLPLLGNCTPDACSHREEPAQGLAQTLKHALLSATTVVTGVLRSQPSSCTIPRSCGIEAELHILLFMSGLPYQHKDWLFGSTRRNHLKKTHARKGKNTDLQQPSHLPRAINTTTLIRQVNEAYEGASHRRFSASPQTPAFPSPALTTARLKRRPQ